MPYSQYSLIGPYNVLNAGRNYINQVYSGLTVNWSSSTGSHSMIKNNVQGSLKNVALGTSSMAAGMTNRAIGNQSLTFWGSGNTATTTFSTILTGSINQCNATHGFIGAGYRNIISGGNYTTILNGANNVISGISTYSTIISGPNHSIRTSRGSLIAGGYTNIIALSSRNSSILGATTSGLSGSSYATIVGGISNEIISSANSSIIGAKSSSIKAASLYASIVGGRSITLSGSSTSIGLGGYSNSMTSSTFSAILAGVSNTMVNANNSVLLGGLFNTVTGNYSAIIAGRGCAVSHYNAVAVGGGAQTRSDFSLSLGNVNTITPNVANNTITLSGAVGYVIAEGGFVTGTADYAENFPFADNNPNGEDRRGYFVSLENDGKIQIGNSNVLGIISATPGVLGDSAEHRWANMYLKDEWDIIVYEDYKVHTWKENSLNNQVITKKVYENNEGVKFKEYPHSSFPQGIEYVGGIDPNAKTTSFRAPKMNPDFNPNEEYIPRSQRKEWAPVGLLGKLYVRTAEKITSDFVDANADGLAVNGTKYRVIKNVRDWNKNQYGIVRVFFK